jgi:N-acetylated-alpha-linked acidic dipeptidase
MKAFWAAVVVVFGLASPGAAAPSLTLRGYTPLASDQERRIESEFIDIPSAQNALDAARAIAARPHYAGTPADHALALYMRDRLRAYGVPAELQALRARVDTPRELVLELAPPADLGAPGRRAKRHGAAAEFPVALDLAEASVPGDPATAAHSIGLPFNAGSGDGDVSAPLVYADRGLDADYDTLAQARVDVAGAVVLVRYGAQFRGLLAQRAQAHGVAGVIFYSDPKDDGAARGPVYPGGPWRPPSAVERGWVGAGIHIPTLPISAANAQILLGALSGIPGPPAWGGTLPVAYPLARGPGRVHLIVRLNRTSATLWNTVGVVPGVHGDQSVILGAHRDAWVYGVANSGSGIITLLEVARGFGYLLESGWRPQRTLIIAGWDGGEIGLAGSGEYARVHALELQRGCMGYFDADTSVTGPAVHAAVVAALAPLLVEAGRAVRDPLLPTATISDRWRAQLPRGGALTGPPGGGTDLESFLAGAGTPAGSVSFRGPFGVDNSSADTLLYATTQSDPDFSLHRAAAQLYGIAALRLADAGTVPYLFSGYTALLRGGTAQLGARAARAALTFDTSLFRRAVDRFAAVAARFDRTGARGDVDGSASALRAARGLDALVYGASGDVPVILPEIDAAVAAHDAGRTGAALRRAADSVNAVADELGR